MSETRKRSYSLSTAKNESHKTEDIFLKRSASHEAVLKAFDYLYDDENISHVDKIVAEILQNLYKTLSIKKAIEEAKKNFIRSTGQGSEARGFTSLFRLAKTAIRSFNVEEITDEQTCCKVLFELLETSSGKCNHKSLKGFIIKQLCVDLGTSEQSPSKQTDEFLEKVRAGLCDNLRLKIEHQFKL